mmetsp:Transcript_115923/g.275459  ORF Transcript_115923/g.275459 Transcript_115923/m.275459 type:complete len:296 (-) Transcript_115923:165-1052(-)
MGHLQGGRERCGDRGLSRFAYLLGWHGVLVRGVPPGIKHLPVEPVDVGQQILAFTWGKLSLGSSRWLVRALQGPEISFCLCLRAVAVRQRTGVAGSGHELSVEGIDAVQHLLARCALLAVALGDTLLTQEAEKLRRLVRAQLLLLRAVCAARSARSTRSVCALSGHAPLFLSLGVLALRVLRPRRSVHQVLWDDGDGVGSRSSTPQGGALGARAARRAVASGSCSQGLPLGLLRFLVDALQPGRALCQQGRDDLYGRLLQVFLERIRNRRGLWLRWLLALRLQVSLFASVNRMVR